MFQGGSDGGGGDSGQRLNNAPPARPPDSPARGGSASNSSSSTESGQGQGTRGTPAAAGTIRSGVASLPLTPNNNPSRPVSGRNLSAGGASLPLTPAPFNIPTRPVSGSNLSAGGSSLPFTPAPYNNLSAQSSTRAISGYNNLSAGGSSPRSTAGYNNSISSGGSPRTAVGFNNSVSSGGSPLSSSRNNLSSGGGGSPRSITTHNSVSSGGSPLSTSHNNLSATAGSPRTAAAGYTNNLSSGGGGGPARNAASSSNVLGTGGGATISPRPLSRSVNNLQSQGEASPRSPTAAHGHPSSGGASPRQQHLQQQQQHYDFEPGESSPRLWGVNSLQSGEASPRTLEAVHNHLSSLAGKGDSPTQEQYHQHQDSLQPGGSSLRTPAAHSHLFGGGGEGGGGGSGGTSPRQYHQHQRQTQSHQDLSQHRPGESEEGSPVAASRLAGRSPRGGHKGGGGGGGGGGWGCSAPSTPRGHRDKSRERGRSGGGDGGGRKTSSSQSLKRAGSSSGGGGERGRGGVVARAARSLSRSRSRGRNKRSGSGGGNSNSNTSAPPTSTTNTKNIKHGGGSSSSNTGHRGGGGGSSGSGGRNTLNNNNNPSSSSRASGPHIDSPAAAEEDASGGQAELSVDARAPGVIKLFGETVSRGAQYKAVLASSRSTSLELVKQALERYALPPDTFAQYVLCDVVGRVTSPHDSVVTSSSSDDSQDEEEGLLNNNNNNNNNNSPNNNRDLSGGEDSIHNNSNVVAVVVEPDDNSDPSYASIGCEDSGLGSSFGGGGVLCSSAISSVFKTLPGCGKGGGGGGGSSSSGGWTAVSSRVLDDGDRPLELQLYWKPPPGLSRRFELHRRDDVIRDSERVMYDDTSGLNDNARRIMLSKVPPGAIPPNPLPPGGIPLSPDSVGRRGGGEPGGKSSSSYVRTGPEGRAVQPIMSPRDADNNNYLSIKGVNLGGGGGGGGGHSVGGLADGGNTTSGNSEVKYAFVCPSIYPYLLTLRGHDIKRDLVLYPLKSKTLTMGRRRTNPPQQQQRTNARSASSLSSNQPHVDDISLQADDVLDAHCRLHLKTLSGDSALSRRYWYCLHVDVLDRAVVFVNGHRVEGTATVHPGDILGVGHHYLFLYKDPTGGFDVPDVLPWYPGAAALYAKVNKGGSCRGGGGGSGGGGGGGGGGVGLTKGGGGGGGDFDPGERDVLNAMVQEVNEQEYFDLDDLHAQNGSVSEDAPLTVPYPRHREEEVLEHVVSISCSSPAHFPLTTTVLLLGCHGYAATRFPPSHQATFFRRLLRAIRGRVSVVSKALSVQKYQSNLYTAPADSGKDDVSRDGDPLLELLCWLSNVVRIYNHVTSAPFRSRLAAPQSQPPGDVTESVQELCDSLEEMISFMFQQTVYSITKVLFAPVGQILQPAPSPCADHSRALAGMERVLHVLKATLDVGEDVSLHRDVILQLLTYLIFFVTTTLFNKLMAKGSGAKLFCWSVGVRLQACVSHLEEWVGSVGLDAHYLRVSERLLSLVDLLATSRHTLLRMDWPSFRRQYSPLSESQLLKVLTEYQFTEGQGPPASWLPPPGVSPTDDVSISLSAHPAFTLPRQGPGMDLSDTFPPPLHDQLQQLTNIFSTDADLSSRGERSSSDASTGRHGQQTDVTLTSSRATGPLGTFFTSESSPNVNDLRDNRPPALLPPHKMNGDGAEFPASPPLPQRHRGGSSPPPPKLPPRSATIHFADPPVQPPAPTPAPRGILSPRNTGRGVANVSARNPPLGGTSGGSSEGSRNNHPGHNSSGGSLSARNPPSGGLFEGSRNPNPGHSAGGSLSARGNPASSSAGGGSGVNGKAGILSNPRTVADAHRSGGGSLSARTHAAAHNHNNNNSSFPDYATVAPSSARSALRGGSSSSKPQNHTDGVGGGDPTAKHVDFATAHDTRLTHSARGAPLYSVPANNTHSTHNNNNTNSGGNSGGGGGGSQGKVKAALQNHARSHPSGGAPPYGHAHSGHAPSGHAPSGHSSADHNHYHQQIQPILKREPPPYHKVSNLSAPEKRGGGGFQQHHHQHQDHQHHAHNSPQDPQSPGFQSQDPRRRPLNGMTLSNGPLTLQDKRIINNVPPLEIPSEDLSNASDSAVSDDVFVQSHSSSADEPMLTAGSSFHSSSDFRRFSAGRLSQDRSEKEGEEERGEGDSGAEVIRVDMRQEPGSDNVTLDTYPDDIYIDVMTTEVEPGGSARQLKVLPLEEGPLTNGYDSDPNDPSQSDDAPRVRYRHKMPQERDSSTKGEITGEVFTLTLLKEGERLGMGLIDGMYTPLKLPGIYVRNVLPGTPAALCGHIRVGDRILAINGRSIVGADYNSAMGLIRSTGPTLNMLIAKCDRSVTARISAS